MRLEEQVCSLELAKRMKELGVRQESYFYYWHPVGMVVNPENIPMQENVVRKWHNMDDRLVVLSHDPKVEFLPFYSAFTVAELGKLIPPHTFFPVRYRDNVWWCDKKPRCGTACEGHKSESDARAKMLIHLIDMGLLNPAKAEAT